MFRDNHKKQRRSSSNSGYEIQKIFDWNIYTRTFGAEVHRSNIRVKRCTTSMKIVNYIERHNLCWNYLLTKSNRTEIETYEVEERTFGTPCTSLEEVRERDSLPFSASNKENGRHLRQCMQAIFFFFGSRKQPQTLEVLSFQQKLRFEILEIPLV